MERSTCRECTLGDIAEFKNGKALPNNQYSLSGKHPVYGANGQITRTNQFLNKDSSIAIGRVGAYCGSVHHISQPSWITDNAIIAIPKNKTDLRFLFYLLSSIDLRRTAIGSAQPLMTQGGLKVLPARVPSVKEQKAIAHILGTLDDKIELNRKMNATLESMAQALFKSWFIDFIPVHAKQKGQKSPGLDKVTADLFPASFRESPLGPIPRGWRISPLRALAGYLSRGVSPAYVDHGGVCVLNQKCIRDRRINFAQARRHDNSKKSVEGRFLQVLDVLVNSTGVGTLGRVAQGWDLPERTIVDSHVTVVRAAEGIDPWFLGIALLSRETDVEALGEGSTGQTELSRTRLGELKCVVPPSELQSSFGRMIAPLLLRLSSNERDSNTLVLLRDALLPKLVSGDLRSRKMKLQGFYDD